MTEEKTTPKEKEMDAMIADKPVVDETTTQPVDEHFSEFNGYETIKEAKAAGYSMAITSDHWFVFDLCLTDLN